jgi:hypothetical protein
MAIHGEPRDHVVPRTTSKDDLADAIAACLKQDPVVGRYVDGHVGRVGTFEDIPRYAEIGVSYEDPAAEASAGSHLLTIHLWSRSENPEVMQSILDAAERAIAASESQLALKREYTELRFDDRFSSFHGLLRVRLSRGSEVGRTTG